jgi:hypothetical protein
MSEAEEKAKRVRSLLSAYYTSGSGDGGGASRAAASIDSAAFDAEAYVTSLVRLPTTAAALRCARAARAPHAHRARAHSSRSQLKKTRLDQLHSKYASMSSEIRALDSDVQARALAFSFSCCPRVTTTD